MRREALSLGGNSFSREGVPLLQLRNQRGGRWEK